MNDIKLQAVHDFDATLHLSVHHNKAVLKTESDDTFIEIRRVNENNESETLTIGKGQVLPLIDYLLEFCKEAGISYASIK